MFNNSKWIQQAFDGIMGSFMRTFIVLETRYLSSQIKVIRCKGDLTGYSDQVGHAVAILVAPMQYRNYTPSFIDIENGVLDIVCHIHGNGPGSDFFYNISAGDVIQMSNPRGFKYYNSEVLQQVFFGDETSLGTALSMHTAMQNKQHQFQFIFELEEDNKEVPQELGLENTLVFTQKDIFYDVEKLKELDLFKSKEWKSANYVLTGNVQAIQTIRKLLKVQKAGEKIFTKGYWLQGKKAL